MTSISLKFIDEIDFTWQIDGSRAPTCRPFELPTVRSPSPPAVQESPLPVGAALAPLVSGEAPNAPVAATLAGSAVIDDQRFEALCLDITLTLIPVSLDFIPFIRWEPRPYPFGEIVAEFFRQKSGRHARFLHKLHNALRIVAQGPGYFSTIGVAWVSDTILKVSGPIFGRLLGLRQVSAALFYRQGCFGSYEFRPVNQLEAIAAVAVEDLAGVDQDEVRLYTHEPGEIFRECSAVAWERRPAERRMASRDVQQPSRSDVES
jgi:hypothetical protein